MQGHQNGPFLAHFGDISYNIPNRRKSLQLSSETSYSTVCCQKGWDITQNLLEPTNIAHTLKIQNNFCQGFRCT